MSEIKNVAVFGASGNLGTPITDALVSAGFHVTAITRPESTSTFPPSLAVIRTPYTVADLTTALTGQDAAVCVIGPAGITSQPAIIDAAATTVKRFIVNDFGWGPDFNSLPEFRQIGEDRKKMWDRAAAKARATPGFSWSGVAIGNPIDRALALFPIFGFDLANHKAIIYDDGTETWTGTTLEGIGQAVVGTLQHLAETAGRAIRVRSIEVCQNELLTAFEDATGEKWDISRETTENLIVRGRKKYETQETGWILDLMVGQMLQPGVGRCVLASREDSDSQLVGVREETPLDVVKKALALFKTDVRVSGN